MRALDGQFLDGLGFLMDNGDDLSLYFGLKKISRKLQEWKFKKKFIKIYIYTIRTILVTLSILRS